MTAEPDSIQTVRFAAALKAGLDSFNGPAGVRVGGSRLWLTGNALIDRIFRWAGQYGLVLLAEQYARQRGISHQAVLIDHGLRPDSADEASRVAKRMRHFGIDIAIRRVDAVAPKGGIQSWARDQRYEILTSIARETGSVLLLAHHEADQAETVFMRLSHGSGLGGLGGMGSNRCLADIPVRDHYWNGDQMNCWRCVGILAAVLRMIQATKIAGLNGFGCDSLWHASLKRKGYGCGIDPFVCRSAGDLLQC